MKKLITMTLAALTMMGGVALADRDHRGRGDRDRGRDRDRNGPVVRGNVRVQVNTGGPRVRNRHRQPRRVRYERRVVRPSSGYFTFNGGVRTRYVRPVIRTRYYDYQARPQVVVENQSPVEGYIWVSGQWTWTGYEWQWQAGYYAPDPNYGAYGYYDDYSY